MLRIPFVIVGIVVLTLVVAPLQALALLLKLPLRRSIPVFYHRWFCAILGIRVKVVGTPMRGHPLLIVANHTSWLDIPIVTSVMSVVFVAKSEVASWPIIGWLAKLQRSVFVERARRHKTHEVNAEIASRLAEGDPVVLFGEGTSSDGNRVLPFRSALVGAARNAVLEVEHGRQVFIQPLSIAYTTFHGLPMGRQHRPIAAWYGDVDMFTHLMGIIRRGVIDVVVTFGEAIAYDAEANRKAIALSLHSTVRKLTTAALRGRPVPGQTI
jgi:lyso-ornithine lipid O-acyltransferase